MERRADTESDGYYLVERVQRNVVFAGPTVQSR